VRKEKGKKNSKASQLNNAIFKRQVQSLQYLIKVLFAVPEILICQILTSHANKKYIN
jgi:hypothetical protein